ncbi:MAG: EAL domain-containing protein [Nitrosomonas sp.]|nr:EAL domain-containing protein [Nitrosomonas sp.]MBP7112762.1 EAL domain-containing protein [Nitrosomonas sp.]
MLMDTNNYYSELIKLLHSDEGNDPTGFPQQAKLFSCGQLLLKYVNNADLKACFAVIEFKNTERSYVYGGALVNLKVWELILKTISNVLPANAYLGRISLGVAIHAWGDTIEQEMLETFRKIEVELMRLSFVCPPFSYKVELHISIKIGYLVYPDDCGILNDFTTVTHYAALTSIGFHDFQRSVRMRRFNQQLVIDANRYCLVEEKLRYALLAESIEMYFQPKIELLSRKIYGAEALARYTDKDIGVIPPVEMLDVIESGRVIIAFTQLTLKKTMHFAARIKHLLPENFRFAINISQHLFNYADFDFVKITQELLEESDCSGNLLEYEITETAYFDQQIADNVLSTLQKVKMLGIKVSVDDFGSGYGALSLISNDVVDTIKIDKQLTDNILDPSKHVNAFLPTLVCATANSGIDIVVEGIEHMWQHDELCRRNIKYGQGYLYSRPIDEVQFIEYLEKASA